MLTVCVCVCVRVCEYMCNRERQSTLSSLKLLFILEPQSSLVILGILVHEQSVVCTHYLHNILPLARGRKGLSLEPVETLPQPLIFSSWKPAHVCCLLGLCYGRDLGVRLTINKVDKLHTASLFCASCLRSFSPGCRHSRHSINIYWFGLQWGGAELYPG